MRRQKKRGWNRGACESVVWESNGKAFWAGLWAPLFPLYWAINAPYVAISDWSCFVFALSGDFPLAVWSREA